MNEHVIAYLLTRYRLTVAKHFRPIDKAIDRECASGSYEAHQQDQEQLFAKIRELKVELGDTQRLMWQQVDHFHAALEN